MKTAILVFLSISLFTVNIFAQEDWGYISIPQGVHIGSLATDTNGTIMLGLLSNPPYKTGVFKSIDAGSSWTKILTINSDFASIHCVEISKNGFIYVGTNYWNTLYYSHDFGSSWDSVTLNDIGNIVAIKAIGTDTVFLSQRIESGSLILRSIDAGLTWKNVLENQNKDEYISDIVLSREGSIYASAMCFNNNHGGVYKSIDGGTTWEFIGLINCQISSLAQNSNGDLFAGVLGGFGNETGGVYILRNGTDTWTPPLYCYPISDMVINSEDVLYCSSIDYVGVVRSLDNGVTFELYNSGLGNSERKHMLIDKYEYIYTDDYFSLYRTTHTTVSNKPIIALDKDIILLYPNPCDNQQRLSIEWHPEINERSILQVVDMTGKVVIEKKLNISSVNSQSIDIRSLPKGTYIIRLACKDKIYKTGFVKL